MKETTDLFGIPVPSTDTLFLTIVVIHIAIALSCVVGGLFAMLSEKGQRRHIVAGKVYYWSMACSLVTIVMMSVMRWPHNIHLLMIGLFAFTFTHLGRRLARNKKTNWTRSHTVLMGLSYVLLLTGFYVDNGKNLPFWKQFSQAFFWVFPSIVGLPIIVYTLFRHPLNRQHAKSS